MDDGAQMRVIEVENVGTDAIEESGVQYIEHLGAAQNTGLSRTAKRPQSGNGDVQGLMARATYGTAKPIEKCSTCFAANGVRQCVGLRRCHITGERFSNYGRYSLCNAIGSPLIFLADPAYSASGSGW